MSAAQALKAAFAAGVSVDLDGDDLSLEASAPPPAAVLSLLTHYKAEVVAMLRSDLRAALHALERRCPDHVEQDRWQQAVADGEALLAQWGNQAHAFGWTVADLFGLHEIRERPHPSYARLSRYDATGLVWLLRGRPVVALTKTTAAIQGTTAVLTYSKFNKPALGPVGDSLDDWGHP